MSFFIIYGLFCWSIYQPRVPNEVFQVSTEPGLDSRHAPVPVQLTQTRGIIIAARIIIIIMHSKNIPFSIQQCLRVPHTPKGIIVRLHHQMLCAY